MPLLTVVKPVKEKEWKCTAQEEKLKLSLPLEQIKSANHDPQLLLQLSDLEANEPEPELVKREVIKALDVANISPVRALAATKHLSVPQRNAVIQAIITFFARKTAATVNLSSVDKITPFALKVIGSEDLENIDLFDFMIRYEEAFKSRKFKVD